MFNEKCSQPIPRTLKIRVYKLDVGCLLAAEISTDNAYAPRCHNLALGTIDAVARSLPVIVDDFIADLRKALAEEEVAQKPGIPHYGTKP